MSKETFDKASNILWDALKSKYTGVMEYAPFSDDYWNEKCKIVICNYENLGYENEAFTKLDHTHFEGWVKNTKSKTVRRSAVFANALKTMLEGKEITPVEIRNSYWEPKKIWNSMKNMTYMNIRPTSGADSGRANTKKTRELIEEYKTEMRNFISALDADVFVISTADSVGLFNYLFDLDTNKLTFKGKTKVNNMRVYSIKHFASIFRYPYRYYHKIAGEIAADILRNQR